MSFGLASIQVRISENNVAWRIEIGPSYANHGCFALIFQGTILAVLVSSGVIADNSWSSYDQIGVATGIQVLAIAETLKPYK